MDYKQIRQTFFDFFASKGHDIVPSAPIVNKEDPSLMFTNAGMNQFKDYFLGNKVPQNPRIADTQKCLRVTGKHNDLEEVGVDSYHQTMFEMLGNWSIGDYFKEEAIDWAWELLTEVYGLDKERLYTTVFEGDDKDGLEADQEAVSYWEKYLPKDRILYFDRKDNFWEMGDTGPCGPCSEIHIDLRSDSERADVDGSELVNMDHPLVVEIWNLVFIQFNRNASGALESLPDKHIDTGMGFERLCMALQSKTSNYDTDVFSGIIDRIAELCDKEYSGSYALNAKKDIAFRVVADHLRAVSFAIADGQLPSNTGAGYVIRRILRRAVRYYYSFLNRHEPLLYILVEDLADSFGDVFTELVEQKEFIQRIVLEEERSFLRTLSEGLKRFANLNVVDGKINGEDVFELYDTYGFPYDLTSLLAEEKGLSIDKQAFDQALEVQKNRSRAHATRKTGDWIELEGVGAQSQFVGYDQLEVEGVSIVKYREVVEGKEKRIEAVLDVTPFYAEGGGQVGDQGVLVSDHEELKVLNTKKDNELIVHYIDKIPDHAESTFRAKIDTGRRQLIENNHSATHLMHAALREVLGDHVTQRGSYLDEHALRFDFSHYNKMSDEELTHVERLVNEKIRQSIPLEEARRIPIAEAKKAGATMFFGEKYGDFVRMITFDASYSRELCGGCHVDNTSLINAFKIVSESAVASGVRRIEAKTSVQVWNYYNDKLGELHQIGRLFKNSNNLTDQIKKLQEENRFLQKQVDKYKSKHAGSLKDELKSKLEKLPNGLSVIISEVAIEDSKAIKQLLFELEKEMEEIIVVLGNTNGSKAGLTAISSKSLVDDKQVHVGNLIKQIAPNIRGGGGGQAFFASAGGSDPNGIAAALKQAKEWALDL